MYLYRSLLIVNADYCLGRYIESQWTILMLNSNIEFKGAYFYQVWGKLTICFGGLLITIIFVIKGTGDLLLIQTVI